MTAAVWTVSVDAEASVLYTQVRSSPQVMGDKRRSRPAEESGVAATQDQSCWCEPRRQLKSDGEEQ